MLALDGWGSMDSLDGRGLFYVDWVGWLVILLGVGLCLVMYLVCIWWHRFGSIGQVGWRIGLVAWSQ